jgi:hypothetical protein
MEKNPKYNDILRCLKEHDTLAIYQLLTDSFQSSLLHQFNHPPVSQIALADKHS